MDFSILLVNLFICLVAVPNIGRKVDLKVKKSFILKWFLYLI